LGQAGSSAAWLLPWPAGQLFRLVTRPEAPRDEDADLDRDGEADREGAERGEEEKLEDGRENEGDPDRREGEATCGGEKTDLGREEIELEREE
jgi:hypothetical protein